MPLRIILLIVATGVATLAAQAETLAPGVTFTTYNAPGPNKVHVVAIDRNNSDYKLKVGWAQGKRYYTARERTSQIFSRYDNPPAEDVLAAINGSYFDGTTAPRLIGIGQTDGQMLDTPTFNAAYTYHTVMVGPARDPIVRTNFNHVQGEIRFADGFTLPLTQYNFTMSGSLAPINGVTVFTPHFDSSTRTSFSSPSYAVEVVVSDVSYPMRGDREISGIVTAINTPTSGNTPIPAGGMVLTTWGLTKTDVVAHTQLGDRIRVYVATGAAEYNNSDNCLTGIGWVTHNGAAYPTGWANLESGAAPYSRNPRTVLAWNDNTWFQVVCDGRSGQSVGMTFQEMSDFVTGTLGATEAVNYDGGGSSTMVVNGTVRNNPSDGSERYVANAIMLVKRDTSTSFPVTDAFAATGRANGWDDKFTYNEVVAVSPAAPGGDGHAVSVKDPAGGVETVRRGDFGDTDYVVESDVYCAYRPGDATDGFERYALFARDNGTGSLSLTGSGYGKGNCYALMYDSDDGRVRAGKYVEGAFTDFLPSPLYLPSSAWRHFRIDCAGSQITYRIDGATIASVSDATFARGYFGLGYAEYFATNSLIHGTRADHFAATLPDAPPLAASSPSPADASVHLPTDSVLAWQRGAGALSHDVYFGTTSPGTFQGNQATVGFDPGTLELDTTYYWRVDAVNDNGTTTGAVWSFTTQYYMGDMDGDLDVDQSDFGGFQACLTGAAVNSTDPACERAKLDADDDIDEEDTGLFVLCFSGPGHVPDAACLTSP